MIKKVGNPADGFYLQDYQIIFIQKLQGIMAQEEIRECKVILQKNKMQPIKRLGKGAFGLVFLVSIVQYKNFQLGKFVAVKCINLKKNRQRPMIKTSIKREIAHMTSLRHPHIVQMYENFECEGWIFMLMQYCENGSLQMIQLQKDNNVFRFQQSIKTTLQVAKGLEYLHLNGIIHRDIKLQNILVKPSKNKNLTITKICDLGLAKTEDNYQLSTTFCGTFNYMAPQVLQKNQYGKQIDIWALGVLIFKMLFGVFPFRGQNILLDIQTKINPIFKLQQILPKSFKNSEQLTNKNFSQIDSILQKIFVIQPEKRISLAELIKLLEKLMISQNKRKKVREIQANQNKSHQLDKAIFLLQVLQQIDSANFLKSCDLNLCKYYMNKVCVSILEQKKERVPAQQKQLLTCIRSELLGLTPIQDCSTTVDHPNKEQKKVDSNFENYKKQYRLVIGHCFAEAHKKIQKFSMKIRMKLKIFCCHSISKIFTQKNIDRYLKACVLGDQNQTKTAQNFSATKFNKWIDSAPSKEIYDLLEKLNQKMCTKA